MKKSLLALAALTAFAGAASAQSSVTLFGIVDAGFARVSAGGNSAMGISNSGYNSSRLGFRGVEDLGGGLKASFHLEGQLFNDVGQGSNATTGFNFLRRSTVSLMGGFGEIRVGRDYTPTFWNTTVYDPFGTNGIGQSMTPAMGGGNQSAAVRSNNSISYFTPAMGGISVQVMKGFGEQLSNAANKKENDYLGFRVGYAAGPISTHVAYGKTEGATDAADVKYMNAGFSFNAGMFVPIVTFAQEKTGAGAKVRGVLAGLNVNLGAGTIRTAYSKYDIANSGNDWNKLALGYVHNLSKRTAVYATYARVSNDGAQTKSVANNGISAGASSAGGSSSGMEFGVRHSF
ncbi:MAG: porin [Rubrivivax sp.]|nr:porin [Rubrivivax sp.]